jgi:hypothetical protein
MPYKYTYRLEFQNFDQNNIRIDISPTDMMTATSGITVPPHGTSFYVLAGTYRIIVYYTSIPFFYIGQVFTVSGTVSNNGVFTVVSIQNTSPFGEVVVAEVVVNEYVLNPTFTDNGAVTTTQIIALLGGAKPLVISTINNGQDKFQPIRSKQAVIQFISNTAGGTDITTFSKGADNLWKVDISIIGGDIIFTGFLILADNQQPFQPDPQTVQLTATDHLGSLKDIALVGYDGLNPTGRYRVADLVTMCLKATGLSLDLYVVNNLRTGSGELQTLAVFNASGSQFEVAAAINWFYPGQKFNITGSLHNDGEYTVRGVGQGIVTIIAVNQSITDEATVLVTFIDILSQTHWYDTGYLDAKTFEDQIGTCINMYDALSQILGQDCYIGQWKGNWWIQRVDELEGNPIYAAHFFPTGVFDVIAAGTTYNKSIGAPETIRFADADTLLQFIRPHGYDLETYGYAYPLEIPANIDFSRGAIISIISAGEKHFTLDDWLKLFSNTSSDDPTTTNIYIRRDYINDQEVKRYAVIEHDATGHYNFIMSEKIWVNAQDKFIIGMSRRMSADISGSGFFRDGCVQVRLYGEDGTFWTCQGITSAIAASSWVACDSTFRTNQKQFVIEGDLSADFTQSQNLFNGDAAELPVGGYLRILIYQCAFDITTKDTYIDSLSFDYLAFINGSYQKYTAQTNRIDRLAPGYLAKEDNQVYIQDSPTKLGKGAIFIPTSTELLFTGTVTFGSPNGISVPGNLATLFYRGQNIKIVGSTLNDKIVKVSAVIYHTIGDTTEIDVVDLIATETHAATLSEVIFTLTRNWYAAAPIALALQTDPSFLHPYGYIQVFSTWNQFRGTDDADGRGLGINIFSGSVLGLTNDWPDLFHKFLLTDSNANTNNRYFMVISISQDWKSCKWTCVMMEVYNTISGKVYSDPFTFSYLTK